MALWFSSGAAGSLLDLEAHVLVSGRRMFIEARRLGTLGRAIWSLRYESPSLRGMERLAVRVWELLLERARKKGVSIPGLT